MNKRTFDIIMACKNHSDDDCNVADSVKRYMSQECDCPISFYGESVVTDIMFNTMLDYLDTCDRPSCFIRTVREIIFGENISLGERIARAFVLVRVKTDDGKYVNGFGEWMK